MAKQAFTSLDNAPSFTSSFKLGRAIFPDWTHKIPSPHHCSHCQQPLFLAFRDTDFRPVLACALCARLYLSKATKPLLVQANDLPDGRNGYPNNKTSLDSLQVPLPPKNTKNGGNNGNFMENHNYVLNNPNRIQIPINKNDSKRYTLKFSVDSRQTRTFLLDALQTLAGYFSDRCELRYQLYTISFHADPSVSKPFVQTFLQIVGQVCGFNCSFSSSLTSRTLSREHLYALRSLLVHLGNKWKKNTLSSHLNTITPPSRKGLADHSVQAPD